jgi:signal transduction histidine kinase
MRLYLKLLLAFAAVVLLAVLIVAALANQAAQREVANLMVGGSMTTESALAAELAGYYRGHGDWDGVLAVLRPEGGQGHMMGQRLLVADAAGVVAADTAGQWLGRVLSAGQLQSGTPILVDGQPAGTLVVLGGMMNGGQGGGQGAATSLLARVNRAIWLAALGASAAAIVVGGLLAYGLVKPVRALTSAAEAIAQGQLSRRVAAQPNDEIGDLAAAFNAMARSLENAERLRRELTADVAHELRNPIAVLQGNLEAVIDGVLPPTPDNLQPLLAQTQVLARLVDDLRTVALAEAGHLSLQREPADPAALAQAAVSQFQAQAEAAGVALNVETASGMPTLLLDHQRIGQVLSNLLSNALRHTPRGGRVVCRVVGDRERVEFRVEDTGSGIPPEALPHIFERFYRADGSRARAEGGTGLGLTIAKQLVEAHGGRISARSEPGRGTAVVFSLPVRAAALT